MLRRYLTGKPEQQCRMEEIMPTQTAAKKYIVHYKTMNEVLKKKRAELKSSRRKSPLLRRWISNCRSRQWICSSEGAKPEI